MKKLILLFLLLFLPLTVKAQDIPTQAPKSGVYDPSGYLSQETINRIKEINNKYAETDLKPQIGIVIVNEIDGNIEQVANETARNWKIGFSDTNNGMLVMIDIKNHKIRTETSNNLSTYITDYQTSILNDTVKSDFRNDDYDSGVNKYLDKYTEMMDRVVSGKEPMSHEEKYMRIILSFMLFAIVAGMIGVLLTKLVQIFSGGDDEVTDDCIEMVVLKFKLLTTLDNNPIDIRSVKDLEKKNHTINQLGKLTEEITRQQLSVADIEKLTLIVNELNEAISQSTTTH